MMTRTVKRLICILGVLSYFTIIGCAGRPMRISSTSKILTNGESLKNGKKAPADYFGLQDEIVFYVYVKWDDPLQSYGKHPVVWNWYSNGKLISTGSKDVDFDKTPKELWTHRSSSALGQGHFRVE